ncbi:DUF2750 domain-containing protein [Paenarthrobacter sp. RAF54_2]|uniref:DUF2750 domain-containing protein n=1 Tax=Paenarthrobacter sp. RAF54_2 TaxID=3233061 RepID=UPI003F986F50
MSISAAQASRFYQEVILHQQVWGIRDSGGFPAPPNGDGERSMPFWSLRSSAEKVTSSIPAYRAFEVEAIPLTVWRTRWIDGFERDGILVGLNWSGVRATGYDIQPLEVRARLEASE